MKVLLVDDSMTMRRIQKRVLMGMGVTDIKEAGDGKEALKILKENNYDFDIMLCDINMPNMSGIETLKNVRSIPETKNLPVIMCTSVADKQQVIQAIKVGASGYVVKPFKPDDLGDKIKSVMASANA